MNYGIFAVVMGIILSILGYCIARIFGGGKLLFALFMSWDTVKIWTVKFGKPPRFSKFASGMLCRVPLLMKCCQITVILTKTYIKHMMVDETLQTW